VEVARELGVEPSLLYRWNTLFKKEATEAFRGSGNRTSAEEEIRQLRKRVRELEEEKEILAKASAYFAKLQK